MKGITVIKGLVLLSMLGGFLTFFSKTINHQSSDSTSQYATSLAATPLIMVPGTDATVNRFDSLIDSLKKKITDIDVVKIEVKTDGTLKVEGTMSAKTNHPIFVIGFEDSSDQTLAKQSGWFQQALQYIQTRYQIKTYNYLGHSNGGLVITEYLENQTTTNDPALGKLMTLGTPFNDVSFDYNEKEDTFDQPKAVSEQFANYLQKNNQIPEGIQMINVVGKVAGTYSDGVVPITSVLAGKLLYNNLASYQELIITEDSQHSALVQNEKVQKTIESFFW